MSSRERARERKRERECNNTRNCFVNNAEAEHRNGGLDTGGRAAGRKWFITLVGQESKRNGGRGGERERCHLCSLPHDIIKNTALFCLFAFPTSHVATVLKTAYGIK